MPQAARLTPFRLACALLVTLLLWAVFTGGRGWDPLGLLMVAAATLAAAWWAPWALLRPSWRALPGFLLWFLDRSLRGGVDVAWRALQRDMPLAPRLVERPMHLPPGGPRSLLVAVISLMPGTLCAEQVGERLVVHVLAEGLDAEVDSLEAHIARLYGLEEPAGVA